MHITLLTCNNIYCDKKTFPGEVGPVITAVWISHLGSRGNKPLWMGIGMLLIAVSLFFWYFLFVCLCYEIVICTVFCFFLANACL